MGERTERLSLLSSGRAEQYGILKCYNKVVTGVANEV